MFEYRDDLVQASHPVDPYAVDFGCLGCGLQRKDYASEAVPRRKLGVYERSRDVPHASVESQFSHYEVAAGVREYLLARCRDYPYGYGQVVAAAVLLHVRRREVYDYLPARNPEARRHQRGRGAQEAFLDGRVGEPDQVDSHPAVDVDLDGDFHRVYSYALCSFDMCEHLDNDNLVYLPSVCSTVC